MTLKNSGIKREFNQLLTLYRNRAQDSIANSPNLINRRDVADAMQYTASVNDIQQVEQLKAQLEQLVQRAQKVTSDRFNQTPPWFHGNANL